MTADEKFLSRWSRVKREARRTEAEPPQPKADAGPAPVAPAPGQATPPPVDAPAAPDLPTIESLQGLASDYTEFLKPGVDENLKRSALKKLFRDPYFETFEKFEAYCEDYTQGEPIPEAMLRTLEHAKGLLFDEKSEIKERTTGPSETQAPVQVVAKVEDPEKAQEEVHPQPQAKD